ncbi:acyl-CoA dehydrogenase [Corallococcus praedator]|uniref:Acyl-CoA dehydrogenase n=1 Tax=Corallococcus praedator TaxID=2316724 RepID=A0ABX9QE94_9BACT|nr:MULTISPECIES: acyl-CoA dehydrogenase family protein [Corallococcus]RKH24874.1 acyl-CoA dehydrogenase [Corallococcus sp. CA031C]RKI03036.1 acyl-CoA dehydrogenase [Corallococcus praedator]
MLHGQGVFQEEHEAFRRTVRAVVDKELRPFANAWEDREEFPRELFRRFGELGFLGLKYPEALGGTAAGELYEAVLLEELGRCGSGGVAAGLGAQFTIATGPLHLFGTEAQKQRWLAPAIQGEKIGALGITEPDAGSDVAGLRTTARRDGDHYVVNGSKTYITNGVRADFVVLAVKTDPERGHKGLSMLVVERGTPGFGVGRKLQKLGWRASDTAELFFEDCRVPAENLLGVEGQGFSQIMGNFQWERLSLALGAVGAMDDMLETVLAHVKERRAFGQTLGQFQVIRHKLAELYTARESARQLTYHALRLHVAGEYAVAQTSMAKKVATETCCRVADECLQLHGGAGYMMEYDIQRHWRDARLGPIGGGTSEVMNEIIAKQLGL